MVCFLIRKERRMIKPNKRKLYRLYLHVYSSIGWFISLNTSNMKRYWNRVLVYSFVILVLQLYLCQDDHMYNINILLQGHKNRTEIQEIPLSCLKHDLQLGKKKKEKNSLKKRVFFLLLLFFNMVNNNCDFLGDRNYGWLKLLRKLPVSQIKLIWWLLSIALL